MAQRTTWLAGAIVCGIAIFAAAQWLGEPRSGSAQDEIRADADPLSATKTEHLATGSAGRQKVGPSDSPRVASEAAPSEPPPTAPESAARGYLERLQELRRMRASAQLTLPFLGSVIADVLDRRGEWISLTLGEPIELGDYQDSNRRLVVRNGARGARGYIATRTEFPLFFELLDLQVEYHAKPGNEQNLDDEHFDRIEAFLRSTLEAEHP
jgi:hypothetical protein